MTSSSNVIHLYTKEELEMMQDDIADMDADHAKAMRSYFQAEEESMLEAVKEYNRNWNKRS